ncbi:hypothetical protein BOX15_Mlig014745g1, partial [Macrostomum lignano]
AIDSSQRAKNMAEPPSKRFRFDARAASTAGPPTTGGAASSSSGGGHGNNNNNAIISNANKIGNEEDPWGDDNIFDDDDFVREFDQICSQNISVVDYKFNRRSSHPSQPQQHQQQLQLPAQQPHQQPQQPRPTVASSPTIRRSVSNQAASGIRYASGAAGASAAAPACPRPTSSTSSSQYYNFQTRRHPPPQAHAAPAVAPSQSGSTVRYSAGGSAAAAAAVSASTMRKPSGPDAVAELRDRLHTVQGQYVALNESVEALKQTLANERAARQKAELDVRKLETERTFSAKEIESLQSENQSLSIRLRKREEQQQQTQFSQLTNRDVIPATQFFQPQFQQQQFPSMASFCSRSPVSGPVPLSMRSPHTPLRPQQQQQQQPPPPPPHSIPAGSPTASVTTEDMEFDENEDVAASMSATPGESDDSDTWPAVSQQPESAGWHKRRAELLALYPGLLVQCSTADRAIRCLTRPQQFQHQRLLPGDILNDMPAAAWSPNARSKVTDALDCLARLTTRELDPTLVSDSSTSSNCGPAEAERLLAPIRSRLSGYLMALRLRGSSPGVCARQLALSLDAAGSADDSFSSVDGGGFSSADASPTRRSMPTPVQLAQLGLDALRQLWRLCQLSDEAALGLLRNVGRRETALVADVFELVRLLPGDHVTDCDAEALHCCLQVLHYLLLRLPENRRHQLVEFFCTGLDAEVRQRLVRSRYLPTVTLYVKILTLVHSRQDGYVTLAEHNDPCRIAELVLSLELRPDTRPEPALLHLINAINCLIRECIAMERLHKPDIGLTLLNRDCRDRCFFKLLCALSNALAQLMPLHYCSMIGVGPSLVSSIQDYIRTTDALKDYLDVQSCKDMVRQDKTHYFIIGVVDSFKDLHASDNKYKEEEYVAPSRPSLDP